MNKTARKLLNLILALFFGAIVIFCAFYVFVSIYYKSGFSYGTVINGVYCAGLSVDEANEKIQGASERDTLTISSSFYDTEEITLSEIGYSEDYSKELLSILEAQENWFWVSNIFNSQSLKNVKPEVSFDEDKLKEKVRELGILSEYGETRTVSCEIKYDYSNGYYFYEDIPKVITYESLFSACKEALYNCENVILSDSLFKDREITVSQLNTRELWTEVSDFLDNEIIYDMGAEQIKIDGQVLSRFLSYDDSFSTFSKNEDGSFKIDEDKVRDYVDSLCETYNTYKKPRDFVTHLGVTKHIELSTYGTELDSKAEEEYLINAVENGISETHIPTYLHQGFVRGLDDIGNTLVEVDLTDQVLYYIKDGYVLMTCDIVSGKPTGGNATPEVVAYIMKKARNTYLRGADYVSFVNYWMPFYKSDGLHDASWQKEFGGERYIRYGSHGCINMKKEDVAALYEEIEVGTPVIVYK